MTVRDATKHLWDEADDLANAINLGIVGGNANIDTFEPKAAARDRNLGAQRRNLRYMTGEPRDRTDRRRYLGGNDAVLADAPR